jgi:predicted ATPase
MITKIEAVNFRCLRNISQTLGHLHVITGPNGSGKTTFLEVPQLLAAYAADGLDALWKSSRATAFEELLFHGEGNSVQLAVEAKVPDSILKKAFNGKGAPYSHVRYELEIGRDEGGDQPGILAENLWLLPKSEPVPRSLIVQQELAFPSVSAAPRKLIKSKTPKGWTKTASKTRQGNAYFKDERTAFNLQIRNPATKSALSTLPEDEVRFPLSNWFKNEMAEHVQKIMLRSEMMQFPVSPLKGNRFAADGSNLPQVVQALHKDPPSWKGWLEHVRTILPIRNIEVEELKANRSLFLVVEYDTGHKVQSWHLSDGTLRLLALTLLAYTQNESAVYLIEEPENGVHPQAIEAVYHSLSSLVDGQALVATHSPVLVAQVEPAQLLCFSKIGDETDIVRGDLHPKLKDWKGKLNLSHLYAAGVLS